ncbi:BnaCnng22750D [Brassica napus]|uniref:BnaCnng22750D protein n=1 Tax=Brassica napus TaxID=3708 RepID=A0A078IRX2_BRANA|nr:BnaCnng22750D [Brassica napus]
MIASKRSHRSNRRGEAMVHERSSMEDGVVEESREKRETNRFEREKETRDLNVQQASEDARVWNKLNKDQGRDDVGNDLLEENKKWKPPISGFAKSNIHSTWKNAKLYSGGVFVIRDFTCNVLLHHARMNLLITEQVNNGASMFIMGSSKYEGSGLSKGGHWPTILLVFRRFTPDCITLSSPMKSIPDATYSHLELTSTTSLSFSPSSPPQFVVESLLSLQSFFTPLLSQLPSTSSSSTKRPHEDPEVIFKAWLRSKFDEFVKLLLDVLVSQQSEDTLRDIVLGTLMEFVKLLNAGRFHSSIFHRILNAIIHSAVDIDVFLDMLTSNMEKFVKTLEASSVVSADRTVIEHSETENESKDSLEFSIRKIYQVLSRIPPPQKQAEKSDHEMWSVSDESSSSEKPKDKKKKNKDQDSSLISPTTIAKRMKLKFTKAWISFLRLPLPLDVYKEVLASIHQTVIPHLSNPAMLCDFLKKSYDIGGVVSVMALSSLFILMTEHGLEYPNFYEKLYYALLVPSVFVAKHRARFLQLLDACLRSLLLPAYLAASFAKKLSRLSLSVPPSGSLVITALIYNQPSCASGIAFPIQRLTEPNECRPKTNKNLGIDYFNNQESDLKKTGAMRSSLWEIDTLRHHYCPPVSRFVSSLETDLTVRAKTTEMKIEDFSSGSYATIFGDEIRMRVKQVPLAFYKAVPTSLFEDSDFPGWTFTISQEEGKC